METRKSKKADLENKRGIFLLTGLIIATGAALFAFEWSTHPIGVHSLGTVYANVVEETVAPVTFREPPKQKIQLPTVAEVLKIVDNNSQVTGEIDLFDPEANAETFIEITPILDSKKEEAEEAPFIAVEIMPEFPGGYAALRKYLADHLNYPVIAQENGVKGTVFVRFIVDRDGSIKNPFVLRGVDPALDKEALRVVNSLPKWRPGLQQGRAVSVFYTVPISFVLQ